LPKLLILLPLLLLLPAIAPAQPAWHEADIHRLQAEMAAGRLTAQALVRTFIARIEALDRAGPRLNAVIELNPDAPDRSPCGSSSGSGVSAAAGSNVQAYGSLAY
jgi:Asp-tRNA(Asn)/Glu-tRNA(Gln) amidotransferase A subunit family amidase